ncbi:8-amino-7-oxononanoate synthase [Singulisphaera sp. PoT]|uniref:8-amino-7-oxononanoate synthase n=1 Tax=Singulisphaera sp. PoT TaxID=3411797 RepID=UPI003BF5AD9C
MLDPLAWIDDELDSYAKQGLARKLVPFDRGPVKANPSCLDFSSNDYLGLAAHPRLIAAACRATEEYGWGAGASPLVSGWTTAHADLAVRLAQFEHAEAVALFPTGFAANLSTVSALVGSGDAVYLDRLCHASLVDGAKLSGASLRVFPHNDTDRLRSTLERDRGRFRRTLIVTEGVFSMDGDLAPLAEIVEVAEAFGAMLLVDEAHGTGVFGSDGRGACSEFNVCDRVQIRVGTLSKALGSVGGFVAGSSRLIDWVVQRARALIYSTSLPPAAAAAAAEALDILESEPERRVHLHAISQHLRTGLSSAGWNVVPSMGPIVPILLGDSHFTIALAERLRTDGFRVAAIRPPTVPKGSARLRISLTANHTYSGLEKLIAALGKPPALPAA